MSQALPVLPLKDTVVFPQIVVPLAVGRDRSMAAIEAAMDDGREFVCVAQRDPDIEEPGLDDIYQIGTIAKINRVEKREGGAQVIVQGDRRVKLQRAVEGGDYLCAEVEHLISLEHAEPSPDSQEVDALTRVNRELAQRIAALYDADNGQQIYQQLVGHISDPVIQMYRIASLANLEVEQQQKVLDCDSVLALMQSINGVLSHELRVTELRREIAEQARDDLDKQQREHVLRQQKQAIEQALGEHDEEEDIAEIRQQLKDAKLPENIQHEVDRELKRLSRMSANAADYQVARAYLELIAELPWHATTEDKLDLGQAQEILDEDHYGLEEVKERILESLAVMQLNPQSKAPIICFVGPPGVGKTSLGQSIARAMGRQFERLSLGGLHDEAELRGHRRTYIGAMPGRILQALRRAEVTNPIIMLDEIDKLGGDFRGDPSAALMEILDPAQNSEFRDNYLNLPYDLSGVMFVTTANTLDGIPRPLLDRMEVMEVSGYSDMEKKAIARSYLIPRQHRSGPARRATAHHRRGAEHGDTPLHQGSRRARTGTGHRAHRPETRPSDRGRPASQRRDQPRAPCRPARPAEIQQGRQSGANTPRCCGGPGLDRSRRQRAVYRGYTHSQRREGNPYRPSWTGDAGICPSGTQLYLVDCQALGH